MAFTRKMLKALGIEEEKIEQIMDAHVEVVDALKNERDTYIEEKHEFDGRCGEWCDRKCPSKMMIDSDMMENVSQSAHQNIGKITFDGRCK